MIVRSRIAGDFEGWDGDTQFVLEDGSVWRQVGWDFLDGYAHRPRVEIRGGVMTVAGFRKAVRVVQVQSY